MSSRIGRDSRFNNEGVDDSMVAWDGLIEQLAAEHVDQKSVDNPHVSPVFGDFTCFPRTYLVTGTREIFLSGTVRSHRKIRNAGVEADLHVYEGISHGECAWPPDRPEVIDHYRDLSAFLRSHLA
jgi:acetyl esterase/lipase